MSILGSLGLGLMSFFGLFVAATLATWLICFFAKDSERESVGAKAEHHEDDDIYSVVRHQFGTNVQNVGVVVSYRDIGQATQDAHARNQQKETHISPRNGVVHVHYMVYKNKLRG